jgi:hypothetical protein
MRIIHPLRKYARQIRSHLAGKRSNRFTPDFATDCISIAGHRHSVDELADRVCANLSKRFLIPSDLLRQRLLDDAPAARRWRANSCDRANADWSTGLPLYHTTTQPLASSGFWQNLERENASDVLQVVRPQRFAFMPRQAQAILLDQVEPKQLVALLDAWMRYAGTPGKIYPYFSSLVVAQRLIACSWALTLIVGFPERRSSLTQLRQRLVAIVAADIAYLEPRAGDAFPNNHLLMDRFIAWFAAAMFPELHTTPPKVDELKKAWCDELMRQTYEDGGGFEHSLHYHEFACEMALIYLMTMRATSTPLTLETERRIQMLFRWQDTLAGDWGTPPIIGNATEDPILPLSADESWCSGIWGIALSALFGEACNVRHEKPELEKAFWLFGHWDNSRADHDHGEQVSQLPDSGFVVFSDDLLGRLIFRTGPARHCKVMAGHMHADLMAIYADHEGEATLVDSGTFSYRFGPDKSGINWRGYFAGPQAHNVLQLGDADPIGSLTADFRDSMTSTRSVLLKSCDPDAIQWVEAKLANCSLFAEWHRGVLQLPNNYRLIYDILPHNNGQQTGRSIRLQFPAETVVKRITDRQRCWSLQCRNSSWVLDMTEQVAGDQLFCGETWPVAGWVSGSYGSRTPAPQLQLNISDTADFAVFGMARDTGSALAETHGVMTPEGDIYIQRVSSEWVDHWLVARSGQIEVAGRFGFVGGVACVRAWTKGTISVWAAELRSLSIESRKIVLRPHQETASFHLADLDHPGSLASLLTVTHLSDSTQVKDGDFH